MAIPPFDHFMRPVLAVLQDGAEQPRKQVMQAAVDEMNLGSDELAETLRGGGNRARSRAHWAIEYLAQAGAVDRPRRGILQINQIGKDLLTAHPDLVLKSDIEHLEGLQDWTRRSRAAAQERREASRESIDRPSVIVGEESPLENLIEAVEVLDRHTASDLVRRLREQEPAFLERAVLQLLHAMGYGGSLNDGEHLGQSHDGGLDGVIRQDALGLERVYVQAKRYAENNTVGSVAIREFVGALTGVGASGGVFITTSSFSPDAKKYVERLTPRVILIDGIRLGQLMVEYEVGVSVTQTLKVTEVDENFFDDI
jgi:restriction system protein